MKRLMDTGLSPFPSPSKSARKRKRKSLDKTAGYHHTFVMKLFDRSVDLAQFCSSLPRPIRGQYPGHTTDQSETASSYPLYPVARAWIRNEPSNLSQAGEYFTITVQCQCTAVLYFFWFVSNQIHND